MENSGEARQYFFFLNLTVKHLVDFNHVSISFNWGGLELEHIALVGTWAIFWLGNFYLYSFQASAVDIFLIKKKWFCIWPSFI